MHFWRHAWLLAGLVPSLADAEANMGIWEIDESCTNYPNGGATTGVDHTSYLQTAFNDALLAAEAAQSSLKFALKKRPEELNDPNGYNEWVRIAESIAVTLGFSPKPNAEESSGDEYWSDVFGVFDTMVATLQAKYNNPREGYNPDLWGGDHAKPLITCGEESWKWIGLDDFIPDSNERLADADRFGPELNMGAVGAWYLKERLVFKYSEKETPILCDPGASALVDIKTNVVAICPGMLTSDAVNRAPMNHIKTQNIISTGSPLYPFIMQLGYLILHEMTHWFSGYTPSYEDDVQSWLTNVKDQPAVDEDGRRLYKVNNHVVGLKNAPSLLDAYEKGWTPIMTYGQRYIWNLARTRTDSQAKYTGPKLAVTCADSLAHFAAMMFYSDWTWAYEGKARKPGRIVDAVSRD